MRRLYWLGLVALGAFALGCSDSPSGRPSNDGGAGNGGAAGGAAGGPAGAGGGATAGAGGAAAGAAGTADAGVGGAAAGGAAGAAGAAALAPPAPIGLAALNADTTFGTTSLSILDTAGGLKKDDCVDSKVPAGGTTPLISTDVVLPSQPQRGGNVVIVDRGNGALTSVNPATCKIARQVAVPNASSLKTDMHDVVIASDSKAYVTRYSPDLTAAATDDSKLGNDVIVIDPAVGTFKARINIDAYASTVTGATILARPDHALIADGKIVVSLNEIDATFKIYGEGKVVIIDPASDTVTASVALTGLYDCEGMDYVTASKTLLVACGGPYADANQVQKSGIAVVDLSVSPPTLTRTITGTAFGGQAVSFGWVLSAPTAASPTRAFASTSDPNFVAPDGLYLFDFALATATQIATSDPFTIGPSAATTALLFVPEFLAASPKIQLFDITATPTPTIGFASDPAIGLSPTEVAWY